MPSNNVQLNMQYIAWDKENEEGKTGDASNHSLVLIKGVTAVSVTNTPTEIDSVNCPGMYNILLTASENNGSFITLAGKSSTTDIRIIPKSWSNQINMKQLNEQLLSTFVGDNIDSFFHNVDAVTTAVVDDIQ